MQDFGHCLQYLHVVPVENIVEQRDWYPKNEHVLGFPQCPTEGARVQLLKTLGTHQWWVAAGELPFLEIGERTVLTADGAFFVLQAAPPPDLFWPVAELPPVPGDRLVVGGPRLAADVVKCLPLVGHLDVACHEIFY